MKKTKNKAAIKYVNILRRNGFKHVVVGNENEFAIELIVDVLPKKNEYATIKKASKVLSKAYMECTTSSQVPHIVVRLK